MVLDSYFLQIASLIFSGVFDVFDITPVPSVSVIKFEHVFVSWVCCEQRYMTPNCCPTETKPRLKLFLKLLYHWYLPKILLKSSPWKIPMVISSLIMWCLKTSHFTDRRMEENFVEEYMFRNASCSVSY